MNWRLLDDDELRVAIARAIGIPYWNHVSRVEDLIRDRRYKNHPAQVVIQELLSDA